MKFKIGILILVVFVIIFSYLRCEIKWPKFELEIPKIEIPKIEIPTKESQESKIKAELVKEAKKKNINYVEDNLSLGTIQLQDVRYSENTSQTPYTVKYPDNYQSILNQEQKEVPAFKQPLEL